MTPQGRHRRPAALAAAALAAACVVVPSAVASIADSVAPSDGGGGLFKPDQAIVRFEPGATSADRREARDKANVDFDSTLGVPRAQVVEVDGSVQAAVRRLERQPGVAYAQPNYIYRSLVVDPPDDTFFGNLWGLSDPALSDPGVSALAAWETTRGRDAEGRAAVIAVLDTGVDLTHPDLMNNLWSDPGQSDVHGYDFVDGDSNPDDYDFHGTHVAGTAAAIAGNGIGIAGVAPEAEIMAVRVLDGDGSGTTADIAAGITYAADNGADVINMSLGGPPGDLAMSNAITAARNVVVVAAAGNSGTDNDTQPVTPCALSQTNLICVAALRQSGGLAIFSNYGANSVDIAAPGTNIVSAKTDYGEFFSEDFESGFGSIWDRSFSAGAVAWGLESSAGNQFATDSPDSNYALAPVSRLLESKLFVDNAMDLTGERGCRLHFKTRYEIEPPDSDGSFFDALFAGATHNDLNVLAAPNSLNGLLAGDGRLFAGTSPGYPFDTFTSEDVSISDFDGRTDVHPTFAIFSDELFPFDGAYIDDVRVLCRDESYDPPESDNYVVFQGTSMATPHVSGVAALVRAAAPTATAAEVVDAIRQGASAMPVVDASRPTATWGIADACQAIAVATRNATPDCPGSSRPSPPSPPAPPTPAPAESTVFTAPAAKKKARDRKRPQTWIAKKPKKRVFARGLWRRVVFRFRSNERGVAYLCKIDGKRFHQCWRKVIRRFAIGKHVIRAKAKDRAGNVDRTPAVYRFRVKRRR